MGAVSATSISLYIHIPFCTLKCSYCDFNSYAGIEALMRPFVEALCDEMRLWSPLMSGRRIETVFFGGGTPSLLPVDDVKQIMSTMREAFDVDPEAEVSFEANPGTVDGDYMRALRTAGVNRISFGVQSFHDDELAALDRIHSAEEAKEAFRLAREVRFQRINLDLIYGLTEQQMARWQATLEEAIALEPEHLSLYALTVEEGTKLAHDIEHGRVRGPDGDMQAAMYEWSCERLDQAGYGQYEISNWCRPREECRHNLVYWRNGEWLGLGPGAHSHLTPARSCRPSGLPPIVHDDGNPVAYRFADVYSPKQYIERVKETHAANSAQSSWLLAPCSLLLSSMRQLAFVEEQTKEMEMADTAILALRLNNGLATGEFERRFERSLDEVYGPVLTEAVSIGLLERENGRLRLTQRGRLLANEVFVRLLAD
jgi:oxygen-independent coproporphyrinogen III oxidase